MHINDLGWKKYITRFPEHSDLKEDAVARVAVENKTNYVLYSSYGELEGVVRGNLLNTATKNADFPKVGDWVKIQKLQGENKAVIETILPRATTIARPDKDTRDLQVIASNVDTMFIVQSLDNDFSLRRTERYLVLARESGTNPVVILSKADLATNVESKIMEVKRLNPELPVYAINATTAQNMDEVTSHLKPGETVVFLGSSGVGKSTLANTLLGYDAQGTGQVRESDSKGRHTTTKRELFILPGGSILIDTPGMRELGISATEETVEKSFTDLETLSRECKYNDCDHIKSEGCKILEGLQAGTIDRKRYESFLKLFKETTFQKAKEDPKEIIKRKQAYKKRQKEYVKIVRQKYKDL
jgi:ribosome biogenesis GTPase / thiamine phosphate phosphatase